MEIDDFLDIGMEVGLLLNRLTLLNEVWFVDELLDAAYGKMRHKILPIAKIAKAIKGIEDILFQFIKSLGFVAHAKPEDPRRAVTSEESRPVEIHGKRLMTVSDFLAGFDDVGDVVVGGVANEFEGEMDLVGLAPVDVTAFVLQVTLKTLHHVGIFRPDGDGDS